MELLIIIGILAAGLLLIAAEVYLIPGLNVVGVIGFVLIVFALGYAFIESGFVGGVLALLGTLAAGGALFYVMWQSGVWDRFVLATSLRRDDRLIARESEQRARYLGKTGKALTPLRPSGVVEIDGERLEVATEGEFIAAGSKVRVVAMDRRRYFVRLAEAPSEESIS
ncbi:NfeD family protein [Rhodocaloribacter sp.]